MLTKICHIGPVESITSHTIRCSLYYAFNSERERKKLMSFVLVECEIPLKNPREVIMHRRKRFEHDEWSGSATISILGDTFTEAQMLELLTKAGNEIGIGHWRPQNGGILGRFSVYIDGLTNNVLRQWRSTTQRPFSNASRRYSAQHSTSQHLYPQHNDPFPPQHNKAHHCAAPRDTTQHPP